MKSNHSDWSLTVEKSKEIAISKTFFRQSQMTLIPPRGRDFPRYSQKLLLKQTSSPMAY
jgi:hypothetical protein